MKRVGIATDASGIRSEYERRFRSRAEYRFQVWRVLCDSFFQEWIPEDGAVLDLGCGWGEFINQIEAKRKFGMDLNPGGSEHLGAEVTFLNQDCAAPWPFENGFLDAVFTSNFFEHLPSKETLQQILNEAFRSLKSGGRLICLGPNIRWLPGAYWDFWDHFLPLTDLSLAEGLELTGFWVEECVSRFLPYTMSGRFQPPVWSVRVYLKSPLLWPIFGKQFLVVGVKP